MNEQKYAVWPDGTYCQFDEIEEYIMSGSSDDFYITNQDQEQEE